MHSRNLLIIGGSGFVSGTMARQALAGGDRVWTITRGEKPLPAGVKSLLADRKDEASMAAAVAAAEVEFDLVIDCIAYAPENARQDLRLLAGKARHLVLISTDFVFEPRARTFPQTVDNRGFLLDDSYGANKRRCEEVLLEAGCGPLPWTILRPCHIYGPGSLLGCLPTHGRDSKLLERIKSGESLCLVGGGHFLQQPIFVRDLAAMALACGAASPGASGKIFPAAGPEIIESREYYRIIAQVLGVEPAPIEDIPVGDYLEQHPEHRSFLCHRIYHLDDLEKAGLPLPQTMMAEGLEEHVRSLL